MLCTLLLCTLLCPPLLPAGCTTRRYSFLVMVLVLPVHMEFARSGEFSVKDRLLAAARCVPCQLRSMLWCRCWAGRGRETVWTIVRAERHVTFAAPCVGCVFAAVALWGVSVASVSSQPHLPPSPAPPLSRTNLMYYAVLLGVGTAGLVLLLVTGRLAPANVLGFAIAVSNAYGLVAGALLVGCCQLLVHGCARHRRTPCPAMCLLFSLIS